MIPIPAVCNIATEACDRWADGSGRLAIRHLLADGGVEDWSFDRLRAASARLANTLAAHGVRRGDRVAVLLAQGPEVAVAHLAAYRMGAIAVPLFVLFGPEALAFRLRDSGASALITDTAGAVTVQGIGIPLVLALGGGPGALDYARETARASDAHAALATGGDDPALIIYTSGTTGSPKGALHGHRVLRGHLPGVETPHDGLPQPGDFMWTPADWAWIGGLLDVLLPSLFWGVPVLAHRFPKFEPEAALTLMARQGVRNAFLPPTALKMLRAVPDAARFCARPRSIGSGGETLGDGLLDWGREAFGVTINEFYGQTECNLVIAGRASWFPRAPGSMGRAVPGHEVAILDDDGAPAPHGEEGVIAVHTPDPVAFLGYWRNPTATAAKYRGDWLLTGDRGRRDAEGNFWFLGRDDDVITSAGYRIGPGEIEDSLSRHPAVAMVAVIGLPDALRTEQVTAVVVPAPGYAPDAALAQAIQNHVRRQVAAHAYPREVVFAETLPMTATGKIMRGVLRTSLGARHTGPEGGA